MVNGNYAKVYKMVSQGLFRDNIGKYFSNGCCLAYIWITSSLDINHYDGHCMFSQTTFINIICCLGFVICIHLYISQLTSNIWELPASVSENEFGRGCKSITTDSSELEIGSKEKFTFMSKTARKASKSSLSSLDIALLHPWKSSVGPAVWHEKKTRVCFYLYLKPPSRVILYAP